MRVFFTLSLFLSTRRHPAHPVPELILHPSIERQALWSRNYDTLTEIHRNDVTEVVDSRLKPERRNNIFPVRWHCSAFGLLSLGPFYRTFRLTIHDFLGVFYRICVFQILPYLCSRSCDRKQFAIFNGLLKIRYCDRTPPYLDKSSMEEIRGRISPMITTLTAIRVEQCSTCHM